MPVASIEHEAQTVVDLAAHLDRLRQRAVAMRDAFGARQRGYFTPTEDEQVRHLLVSYTHTRNALLELIAELRRREDLYLETDPGPFVVGYAAAVTLVDAARFLHETWDGEMVIRNKLNEGEPAFGIAAGTYSQICKSLTSPIHAWMLYEAGRYYQRVSPALAQRPDLTTLAGMIDTLNHRVHVRKRDYLRARARIRARGLMERLRQGTVEGAFYFVQESVSRLVSHIRTDPAHVPSLPQQVRQSLLSILQPGDVLVTRKEFAATNYFLPGYWPHGALYLGEGRVLEALKDGVKVRSIDTPFGCDAIVVIRPRLSESAVGKGLERGKRHAGKPYDFDFDFTRADRLVCTEVIYRSFEGVDGLSFMLTPRTGRMTLSAEDLLTMARKREGFDPLAVYCPALDSSIVEADDADGILDRTLGGLKRE